MIQAVSYLDFYSADRWMMSLFPPAFSICVMLGVVATFATYLGTRSRTTRSRSCARCSLLIALAGMLDYEVEISSLGELVPVAAISSSCVRSRADGSAQNSRRQGDRPGESSRGPLRRSTSKESHAAREKLLDRWAANHSRRLTASPDTAKKPVLVVVATSGGAPSRRRLDRDRAGLPRRRNSMTFTITSA